MTASSPKVTVAEVWPYRMITGIEAPISACNTMAT